MKMNFLRGMGAGMMVGAALGMMLMPDKRAARRSLSRMFKAAGNVIEDLSGSIGL